MFGREVVGFWREGLRGGFVRYVEGFGIFSLFFFCLALRYIEFEGDIFLVVFWVIRWDIFDMFWRSVRLSGSFFVRIFGFVSLVGLVSGGWEMG